VRTRARPDTIRRTPSFRRKLGLKLRVAFGEVASESVAYSSAREM